MTKLFWLSALITLGLIGIQLIGYPTLELIVLFLLINVVIARYSGERTIKNFGKQAEEYAGKFSFFKSSVGEIEKAVNETQKNIGEITTFMHEAKSMQERESLTLGTIQSALDRHKEDLRTEFKNDLDRFASKVIDMENNFHDFKRSFASAIGAIDDRLKIIEVNGKGKTTAEAVAEQMHEEYVELQNETQN